MLNAADRVRWGNRPGGGGMSGELCSWFMADWSGWSGHWVSNAYEFSTQLGVPHCCPTERGGFELAAAGVRAVRISNSLAARMAGVLPDSGHVLSWQLLVV